MLYHCSEVPKIRGFVMKAKILTAVLISIVLLVTPQTSTAQESGIIQAIAIVVSSLSITGVNNLNFTTVTPGVNKSVDKTDVGFAGEWGIAGAASAELSLVFTLPTVLYTPDSAATMTINFGATDASYEDGTGSGQIAPAGTINPNGPTAQRLGVAGTLSVWIGGRVQPNIAQTGGSYSADVVLSVAYTGS